MKIMYLLFFSILYSVSGVFAQARHTIFLTTGYTYNNFVEINKEEVLNSNGFLLALGFNYKLFTFKKTYTEIGLAAKSIFSSGILNDNRFNAQTLRLAMPLKVTYPLSNKWEASGGFIFQNNVDIGELDFKLRDKYSWRVDMLVEAKYLLNEHWYSTAGLTMNLRSIPDPYFINDPKIAFLIGIAKRISFAKNSKTPKTKL